LARLFIIGLAPGAHGSNRTGRNFTGDASGDFLYPALFRAGFASQPLATQREDGMQLRDAYMAAVCRCAPPDNKPLPEELLACRPYLQAELELLVNLRGVVALGKIAFDAFLACVRQMGWKVPTLEFGHGVYYSLGAGRPWLIGSYHPSRQNTQTGRLTAAMFDEIWQRAKQEIA
jgi:uracil-DNA glycosylase family 4